MSLRRVLPVAALALAAMLGAAAALPAQTQAEVNAALRADPRLQGPLMAAGIAAAIAEFCPSIEARVMRARADALGLYNRGRAMGYTSQQMRAFVRDRAERDWLERQIRAWFAARGLHEGGPAEGFCALGRAQIAENAPAARYLRAR